MKNLILLFLLAFTFSSFASAKMELVMNPVTSHPMFESQKLSTSVITEVQAKKVFEYLKNQTYIPFDYPEDGCYARAHEMSILMLRAGIQSIKVFVIGSLRAQSQNAQNHQYVEWGWHVAPVVQVKLADRVLPMVFDPSLFSKPVSVSDWVVLQTKRQQNDIQDVYFTARSTFTPPWGVPSTQLAWSSRDLERSYSTLVHYQAIKHKQINLVPRWKLSDVEGFETEIKNYRSKIGQTYLK